MTPVKTLPKFKCDFCKRRGVKSAMERHERQCFRNPNRVCDACNNTGTITVDIGFEGHTQTEPCHYCSKFDPQMRAEIEEYEATPAQGDTQAETGRTEETTP